MLALTRTTTFDHDFDLYAAFLQACYSPIDFDYLQFHHTRLGEYNRRREAFHSEARRVFGSGHKTAAAAAGGSAGVQGAPQQAAAAADDAESAGDAIGAPRVALA
jgi:hypothetical protein